MYRLSLNHPVIRFPLLLCGFFLLCYIACYAWVIGRAAILPAVPPVMMEHDSTRIPIVYHPLYNLSLFGIEQVHPFDTYKYQKAYEGLLKAKRIEADNIYTPSYPEDSQLLSVHAPEQLEQLQSPNAIAHMAEIMPLAMLPAGVLQRAVLNPQKLATGGTILAAELALQDGWAINLSGGYHHAAPHRAWGFCAYNDIAIAWHHIRQSNSNIRRVMIIDLDAHQGDGTGYALGDDPEVYILDAYNPYVFPYDPLGVAGVDMPIRIEPGIRTAAYLQTIEDALLQAFDAFTPDMVFYIAGTDILDGDPLGGLRISEDGVIARDALVVRTVRERNIPLVITLAGGYQPETGPLIARSIDTFWPYLKTMSDS